MAQVSTPPDRMMHRLDLEVGSSPPVRLWMAEREVSNIDRNWSTFDLLGVMVVYCCYILCSNGLKRYYAVMCRPSAHQCCDHCQDAIAIKNRSNTTRST